MGDFVYDVSKFLNDHPGGREIILRVAGRDATDDFEEAEHSKDARDMLSKYRIGRLISKTVSERKEIKQKKTVEIKKETEKSKAIDTKETKITDQKSKQF